MQPSNSFEPYEFISVDSSSNAGIPRGEDARRLIRRQAMSRVAADRRQKANRGQQNRRQYSISRPELERQAEAADNAAATGAILTHSSSRQPDVPSTEMVRPAVPASIPSSGYELMRIKYGFDLLDVSALTSFQTGRITAQLLFRDPFLLAQVLQCRQWSYFSFLPSRYGYIACLDDASNCVAARIRQWMSFPSDPPNDYVLSLYSKSLSSLQNSLNDPVLCRQPEVLCATAILAIYEFLNNAGDEAWVRHVAGASALMRLRGPQRYQTDFEKALFMAQVGPIYTEAILNDDECFLDHDVWHNVFRSVVSDTRTLSYSSSIIVSLWITISPIPRLFKDVQNAVCMSKDTDPRVIRNLLARARDIRALLSQWRHEYDKWISSYSSPEQLEDGTEYETLGIFMANTIMLNRMSTSLDIRAGSELEDDAQSLARELLEVQRRANATNPRTSLFMAFKAVVAGATVATKNEWQQAMGLELEVDAGSNSIISRHVFEHWVNLKGRKISSVPTSVKLS